MGGLGHSSSAHLLYGRPWIPCQQGKGLGWCWGWPLLCGLSLWAVAFSGCRVKITFGCSYVTPLAGRVASALKMQLRNWKQKKLPHHFYARWNVDKDITQTNEPKQSVTQNKCRVESYLETYVTRKGVLLRLWWLPDCHFRLKSIWGQQAQIWHYFYHAQYVPHQP